MILLDVDAINIITQLEKNGFEAYIVGGSVRDNILGLPVHDWDICTSATPDQIQLIFPNTIATGLKHGTITVINQNKVFELTTFRNDGIYSDKRRPDTVQFSTFLSDDLSRRDFTMNAIAADKMGNLIDPFEGVNDISNKTIKTVGNPHKRFSEDALRILRALRFASVLGFTIENNTAIAILEQRHMLQYISKERIFSELKACLTGKHVGEIFLTYKEVFAEIIPELKPTFDFNQNNRHHIFDVYVHIVKTVENIQPDVELRLCMLLHDIAKPFCESKDNTGESHFYGHPQKSEELARIILTRLKCDRNTMKTVLQLIHEHDRNIPPTKSDIKKFLSLYNIDFFLKLLSVKKADIAAQAPRYAKENLAYLDNLFTLCKQILSNDECFMLKQLAINGSDLIQQGFYGKEIGTALSLLLQMVIEEKIKNNRQELLDFIKKNKKTP